MSLTPSTSTRRRDRISSGINLDIIAWGFIIASVIFLVAVQVEASNTGVIIDGLRGVSAIILMIVGLIMAYASGTPVKQDYYLSIDEFYSIISTSILGLIVIFMANIVSEIIIPTQLINNIQLSILLAITETVFVIGVFEGLSTWMGRKTFFSDVIATLITGIVWSVYHTWVYGVNLQIYFIILVSSFVLTFTYRFTNNRLSTPIIIHVLNNSIAVLDPSQSIIIISVLLVMVISSGGYLYIKGGIK